MMSAIIHAMLLACLIMVLMSAAVLALFMRHGHLKEEESPAGTPPRRAWKPAGLPRPNPTPTTTVGTTGRGGIASFSHAQRSDMTTPPGNTGRQYVAHIVRIGQRWRRTARGPDHDRIAVVRQIHRRDRKVDLYWEGDNPLVKGTVWREDFAILRKRYRLIEDDKTPKPRGKP